MFISALKRIHCRNMRVPCGICGSTMGSNVTADPRESTVSICGHSAVLTSLTLLHCTHVRNHRSTADRPRTTDVPQNEISEYAQPVEGRVTTIKIGARFLQLAIIFEEYQHLYRRKFLSQEIVMMWKFHKTRIGGTRSTPK